MLKIFFSAERSISRRCFDFQRELEWGLESIGAESVAHWFPALVATTAALLVYLLLTTGFPKPKRFLTALATPATFYVVLQGTRYAMQNFVNFCF